MDCPVVALFSDTEVHCGRRLSNGKHAAIPYGTHREWLCRNVNSICIAPLFIALLNRAVDSTTPIHDRRRRWLYKPLME